MDTSLERIIDGLKKAIQAEGDGHNFYVMAAQSTKDPKGKEVFLRMAEEEKEHIIYLRHQYKTIKETGKPDKSVELASPAQLSGTSPIFSDKIKSRINDAHLEMSALSIGIQLELNSISFYKQQATEATLPEVKKFYRELVDWETGHYHALLRQQEILKEDYWNAAGFSPF